MTLEISGGIHIIKHSSFLESSGKLLNMWKPGHSSVKVSYWTLNWKKIKMFLKNSLKFNEGEEADFKAILVLYQVPG